MKTPNTQEVKTRRLQKILSICKSNISTGEGTKKVWPGAAVALILSEIELIHGRLRTRNIPEDMLKKIRRLSTKHPTQRLWDSILVYELASVTTHSGANPTYNPPTKGRCSNCGQLSVRLLKPPLVEIPFDRIHQPPDTLEDLKPGDHVAWTSNFTPRSPFEIIEIHEDTMLCLAPEAHSNERYCYLCFAGHVWPSLRPFTVNTPPEMQFDPKHPWWDPKWISQGREPSRHKKEPAQ